MGLQEPVVPRARTTGIWDADGRTLLRHRVSDRSPIALPAIGCLAAVEHALGDHGRTTRLLQDALRHVRDRQSMAPSTRRAGRLESQLWQRLRADGRAR